MGNYNEFDLDLNISYEEKTGNNISEKNGSTVGCYISQTVTEIFTEHYTNSYVNGGCESVDVGTCVCTGATYSGPCGSGGIGVNRCG